MFFTRRYFRLAAVVRGVREGPREHFDPRGLPSLPNIKHFVELRGRHGGKVFGAPVEGIGKKLDGRFFVGAGGLSQRFGSRHVREGLRVGFCDVDHKLAEAHLLRIRFEIVAFGGHGFGHRQSKFFADLPVLREKGFEIVLGGAASGSGHAR